MNILEALGVAFLSLAALLLTLACSLVVLWLVGRQEREKFDKTCDALEELLAQTAADDMSSTSGPSRS